MNSIPKYNVGLLRARRRLRPALSARPARPTGGESSPPALSSGYPRFRLHAPWRSPPPDCAACPRAHCAPGFRGRFLSCALHAAAARTEEQMLPSRTATPSAHAPPCVHAIALRRRIQVPYFSFRCPVSHRARSPTAARRGVTLQAKQHLPYVPGEPSTNIRVHLCVLYLRSGFVFAALIVCHYCTQLCVPASILLCESAAIPHAVVPHYKQSNTFPMSLENHQKIYGYTCVYSISVSGLVFAALAVCHYCTQQIRHAETYRRPLARSRTLWCHTTSKAIPSLCPWRTINKYTGTLVCILSPFLGLCSPRFPCVTAARKYWRSA